MPFNLYHDVAEFGYDITLYLTGYVLTTKELDISKSWIPTAPKFSKQRTPIVAINCQGTVSLDSSDTRRRGGGSDTQGRGEEGGGRSPLSAQTGRDGAADPVRVAGALKL